MPLIRFTPWKLIGALLILGPTVAIGMVCAAFIPSEEIPRVSQAPIGAMTFHFVSLRDCVIPPVVAVSIVLFSVVAVRVIPDSMIADSIDESRWQSYPIALRVLFSVIRMVLYAVILLLFLTVVVVMPYREIKTFIVDKDAVIVESLVRSWTIPRSKVARAELREENILRNQQVRTHVYFELVSDDGSRFSTTEVSLEGADPLLQRYEKVGQQLAAVLKNQE